MTETFTIFLGTLIVLLSAIVAILGVATNLRRPKGRNLTVAGWFVVISHTIIFSAAVTMIMLSVAENRRKAAIKEWKSVPISDLTLGFELSQEDVQSLLKGGHTLAYINMEVSINRQPSIKIPVEEVNLAIIDWEKAEVRIDAAEFLKDFPKTVGDLIGHELKFTENNTCPFRTFKCINLYHRRNATVPFLKLNANTHQPVGGYYFRIWYPRPRFESIDGSFYDNRAFRVTPDLLPDKAMTQMLIRVDQ